MDANDLVHSVPKPEAVHQCALPQPSTLSELAVTKAWKIFVFPVAYSLPEAQRRTPL